jgi:RNA polymerase sigma factor (sigma-70 family)
MAAEEDAPPKPEIDAFTRRQVRQDMGSVPPKRAFELLAEFEPLVARESRRYARRTRQCPWFGVEDYLSVGQIAVIEAFVLYRAENGTTLKTWVTKVVKWRLSAAASRVQDPLDLQAAIQSAVRAVESGRGTQAQVSAAYRRAEAHAHELVTYHEDPANVGYDAPFGYNTVASPEPSPEVLCMAKQDAERVQDSLRGLEVRQQAIIASEMQGASLPGLAGELGVSRARLYQQRGVAHHRLRRLLSGSATG